MRIELVRTALAFLLAASLAGCAGKEAAVEPAPEPPARTPSPPAAEVPRPPVKVIVEEPEPRQLWPELFLAPGETNGENAALVAGRVAATSGEFEAASPVSPPEPLEPRDQLLVLDHLLSDPLFHDPGFKEQARGALRERLANLFLERAIADRLIVTDEEVAARYAANAAAYQRPEQVRVRLILAPTREAADQALARIRAGESFQTVASEVSIHPSRAAGGEIEPFSRGVLHPDIEELAFRLEPGSIGRTETARGVFIIEKISHREAATIPLPDVSGDIRQAILSEKRAEARERFLEDLRRAADAP